MADEVVLYVGTKRGLFIARSEGGRVSWRLSPPLLAGHEVYHAFLDPRDGRTAWAATDHKVWGTHVHRSDDGGATWDVLAAAPHHAGGRGVKAIWEVAPGSTSEPATLFAGIEPAGLFVTTDRGESWAPVRALNDHVTNGTWQPAGGALALHSILVDPADERRVYCAISAGGVYRSDDAGAHWTPINVGVRAEFLPERFPAAGQCVHKLVLHPLRPERLYQQNHCGAYRSDDAGDSWTEITEGLPSDFGYVLAVDPSDPDTAFVIPEESSHVRTTVGGMLRVFRTVNAGGTWQPMTEGLPQCDAYVSILREAMATDALDPCGVYFGTSSGHLFASRDRGETWTAIAAYLPRILSVTAAPAAPAVALRT